MPARISCRPLLFALGLGLLTGWGSECRAAGMYTVTDFGPDEFPGGGSHLHPQWDEAQAQHPGLAMTLTGAEQSALPSVTASQRNGYPDIQIPMTAFQNTDSGIVLGVAPVGLLYASPSERAFGYSQKQADGTFGPFVPLAIENSSNSYYQGTPGLDSQGHILGTDYLGRPIPLVTQFGDYPVLNGSGSLDARGHILIMNGLGQELVDLNTGTRADLASLFPLGTLGPDGHIFSATLAADGTIFAEVGSKAGTLPDGSYDHLLMLTPVSTPEPSTLAAFAVLVVGLAVTRRRSRA